MVPISQVVPVTWYVVNHCQPCMLWVSGILSMSETLVLSVTWYVLNHMVCFQSHSSSSFSVSVSLCKSRGMLSVTISQWPWYVVSPVVQSLVHCQSLSVSGMLSVLWYVVSPVVQSLVHCQSLPGENSKAAGIGSDYTLGTATDHHFISHIGRNPSSGANTLSS